MISILERTVKNPKVVTAFIVAILVHLMGARLIPHFSDVIKPMVILVVWFALSNRVITSMVGGMVVGWTVDAVTPVLFGIHGLAFTLMGYFVASFRRRFLLMQYRNILLLLLISVALQELVVVILRFLLLENPPIPSVGWIAGEIVATSAVGLFVLYGENRLGHTLSKMKRRRESRLR